MHLEEDSVNYFVNNIFNSQNIYKNNSKTPSIISGCIESQFEEDIFQQIFQKGEDSLTWDQGYSVCEFDILWLKGAGKVYFYETLNNYIKIDNKESYTSVTNLYNNLIELFSLCVE